MFEELGGKMLKELVEQLKDHEGIRLKPYKCTAGKLTIGIGRNIEDIGISLQEAECMLFNDIERVMKELEDIFDDFDIFSETRKIALIDMIFNLGLTRFLKFKKMIAAIKEENWNKAADEAMDSRWYNQVGRRAEKVVSQLRGRS